MKTEQERDPWDGRRRDVDDAAHLGKSTKPKCKPKRAKPAETSTGNTKNTKPSK